MSGVELSGAAEVILRLQEMGTAARRAVGAVVAEEAAALQADIRARIGTGEFFKDPNDRVRQALWSSVEDDGTAVTGAVGAKPIVLGNGFNLAAGLEYGTAAHDIVVRKAKALAFVLGGTLMFRQRVHHPGTRAYHFVTGPFAERRERIRERIAAAVAITGESP